MVKGTLEAESMVHVPFRRGGRDIPRCPQGSQPGEGPVEPEMSFPGSSRSYSLRQRRELAMPRSLEATGRSLHLTAPA